MKNYKLYTICTLILSNPLHLTVGSKIILTTINFEFQKVVMDFFFFFFPVFIIAKGYHQDINLLHTIILVIHQCFLVKSGSPLVCFHHKITILILNTPNKNIVPLQLFHT